MPPELTPRDGAKLPPKAEQLRPADKETMDAIAELTKNEANALNSMATSAMHTAEMTSLMAETLDDIKDILIKVCQSTGMALPKRIADAIAAQEYDPDDTGEDEDDEPAKG